MRLKVGLEWFECQRGQPIMVELAPGDKKNIANMHPDATRYAIFDDDEDMTTEQKVAWMQDGARLKSTDG